MYVCRNSIEVAANRHAEHEVISMAKRRANKNKLSTKTVKCTEALREQMLSLSNKKRPKINRKDTQVLSYEFTFRLGKAT